MKPTIKDVANLAGVSFKTVSRVINNEGTVGEALQEKVWKAVKELNYRPNLSARGLRGAASSIGFIYDNPNSNYVIDMQHGILDACRAQGYELVIHPCQSDAEDIVQEVLEMIDRSRVGGLVLTPPISENEAIIAATREKGVHIVRVLSGSEAPDNRSPCIYIDDRRAARTITSHLISLGHRNIAFLNGDEAHKSSGERLLGYQEALQEAGIPVAEENILPGLYSFESGVERTRSLIESRGEAMPTAVFACNDEIAAGTLFAARIAGIDVPGRLSIAGFEDSPFSRQAWPNLTTAQQPTSVIAQHAAQLLIRTIKSREPGQAAESEGFYPNLVVRDSTCPAPN